LAGTALGEWIETHWDSHVDHVVILQFADVAALPATRISGQLEGLESILGTVPKDMIISVNGGASIALFEEAVDSVFQSISNNDRIAVLSFNDNATMGALRSAQNHRVEGNIAIVGQGADRSVRDEIRRPNSPIIGATAFWPERYGEKLIAIAQSILRGDSVPPAIYIDHVFLSADNIDDHYPQEVG